jgi:hypothetical protein
MRYRRADKRIHRKLNRRYFTCFPAYSKAPPVRSAPGPR